jgi:hypothetical protein
VAEFRELARAAIEAMIKGKLGQERFGGCFKLSAWANVLRDGNYNVLRCHPESAWSGVYCVDAGDLPTDDGLGGILELHDPRPTVEMVPAPRGPSASRSATSP